jgi:hypothetical protein
MRSEVAKTFFKAFFKVLPIGLVIILLFYWATQLETLWWNYRNYQRNKYDYKVEVVDKINANLLLYELCLKNENKLKNTLNDCVNYSFNLGMQLMMAQEYFALDENTKEKINTILYRPNETLDPHSLALSKQVYTTLNSKLKQKDKKTKDFLDSYFGRKGNKHA